MIELSTLILNGDQAAIVDLILEPRPYIGDEGSVDQKLIGAGTPPIVVINQQFVGSSNQVLDEPRVELEREPILRSARFDDRGVGFTELGKARGGLFRVEPGRAKGVLVVVQHRR